MPEIPADGTNSQPQDNNPQGTDVVDNNQNPNPVPSTTGIQPQDNMQEPVQNTQENTQNIPSTPNPTEPAVTENQFVPETPQPSQTSYPEPEIPTTQYTPATGGYSGTRSRSKSKIFFALILFAGLLFFFGAVGYYLLYSSSSPVSNLNIPFLNKTSNETPVTNQPVANPQNNEAEPVETGTGDEIIDTLNTEDESSDINDVQETLNDIDFYGIESDLPETIE